MSGSSVSGYSPPPDMEAKRGQLADEVFTKLAGAKTGKVKVEYNGKPITFNINPTSTAPTDTEIKQIIKDLIDNAKLYDGRNKFGVKYSKVEIEKGTAGVDIVKKTFTQTSAQKFTTDPNALKPNIQRDPITNLYVKIIKPPSSAAPAPAAPASAPPSSPALPPLPPPPSPPPVGAAPPTAAAKPVLPAPPSTPATASPPGGPPPPIDMPPPPPATPSTVAAPGGPPPPRDMPPPPPATPSTAAAPGGPPPPIDMPPPPPPSWTPPAGSAPPSPPPSPKKAPASAITSTISTSSPPKPASPLSTPTASPSSSEKYKLFNDLNLKGDMAEDRLNKLVANHAKLINDGDIDKKAAQIVLGKIINNDAEFTTDDIDHLQHIRDHLKTEKGKKEIKQYEILNKLMQAAGF
jgi:hypothetical protein